MSQVMGVLLPRFAINRYNKNQVTRQPDLRDPTHILQNEVERRPAQPQTHLGWQIIQYHHQQKRID